MTQFFPVPVRRSVYRAVFHDFADALGGLLADRRDADRNPVRPAVSIKAVG